ncbi:Uncharacterized damage-inducible protein DinB (forms a four-helix bundle) [Algoriphagus locisalis]|uniref:Uncharacterized damage-inducible protein DinB (Forms a four-helix bundle) n=1 Tax=Algoriphagus locisalis TaxID=305507 RepID=A0A1I7BZT9_9BACT|nr:DinB family protein [Algoriphagus locisalis]SFT92684.1 Uncharacterized damage-inducible protein DinB (forms a four-helix bundle) [Algoriphagus locisalis]
MKVFYKDFFQYNYQVNQELARSFKSYGDAIGEDIARLANHILNAQQIWIGRINGEKTLSSPWVDFPLSSFEERNQELFDLTLEVISLRELDEHIHFRNFAGQEFQNKISDILTHLVNHSTYHRGQIALLMRAAGFEPVKSDFIYFKR